MTLSFHKKGTNVPLKSQPKSTTSGNNQDSYLNGIGSYEFIKSLGSGKFSKVMLAYHLETHQQVAIKVSPSISKYTLMRCLLTCSFYFQIIDKQAHDYRVMSRLVREISIMEILQHEYIVKLYETFESCDSLFLVMEYVPGWNLDEYLQKKSQGALGEDEARHLFRQLVTAVDFCHRKWVVHRDLKVNKVEFPFLVFALFIYPSSFQIDAKYINYTGWTSEISGFWAWKQIWITTFKNHLW